MSFQRGWHQVYYSSSCFLGITWCTSWLRESRTKPVPFLKALSFKKRTPAWVAFPPLLPKTIACPEASALFQKYFAGMFPFPLSPKLFDPYFLEILVTRKIQTKYCLNFLGRVCLLTSKDSWTRSFFMLGLSSYLQALLNYHIFFFPASVICIYYS